MLIGFEGTAGSWDSLSSATSAVWQARAEKVWGALNEPIPFAQHMQTDLARKAGKVAESAALHAPLTSPAGLAMRAASGLIGDATRVGVGSVQAIGSQLGKAGQALQQGSIGEREYADATVQAAQRLLERHGFVHQLVSAYAKRGHAEYMRGPTTLGGQDEEIVVEGVNKVISRRKPGEDLIVTGYSRGGLNAINACNQLARHGHEIQLLILFDPVDRDPALGRCNISAAVHNCIMVQRTGAIVSWKPYVRQFNLGTTRVKVTYPVVGVASRATFGRMVDNSDKRELTRGELVVKEIDATHAALGGVPWTGDFPLYLTQQLDRAATIAVAAFINKQLTLMCQWNPDLRLTQPQIYN